MKRILVIDDDRLVRKSFALSLEDSGYRVDQAESGEKGIEMAQKDRYDLICLDLRMPGMDGIGTLREIRKIDSGVPVYIVTAFHEEYFEQLRRALEDGIQFEVLRKPVSACQILFFVKNILEGPVIQ